MNIAQYIAANNYVTGFYGRIQMLLNDPLGFLMMILLMLPALLIGFSLHEAAHAFAANKMGDPTAKNLGRLSFDPLRHIDPIGFVSIILFGIGWAKPVPVNPNNYKNRRKGEFWVSISGIMTNLLIGIVSCFLYVLFIKIAIGSNINQTALEIIVGLLANMISINFMLAVFNLLPIHPLDGMGVVISIFWGKTFRYESFMARYGQWVLLGLIFTGLLSMVIGPAINFFSKTFINLFAMLLGF